MENREPRSDYPRLPVLLVDPRAKSLSSHVIVPVTDEPRDKAGHLLTAYAG